MHDNIHTRARASKEKETINFMTIHWEYILRTSAMPLSNQTGFLNFSRSLSLSLEIMSSSDEEYLIINQTNSNKKNYVTSSLIAPPSFYYIESLNTL